MQHKFGDVVTYVRAGEEINALVAQSQMQPDGEHLTLLYLDPALASPLLSGSALDKAVCKAFAVPLTGDMKYGWKEKPTGLGTVLARMAAQPSAADLDATAEEQKAKEATEPSASDPTSASTTSETLTEQPSSPAQPTSEANTSELPEGQHEESALKPEVTDTHPSES